MQKLNFFFLDALWHIQSTVLPVLDPASSTGKQKGKWFDLIPLDGQQIESGLLQPLLLFSPRSSHLLSGESVNIVLAFPQSKPWVSPPPPPHAAPLNQHNAIRSETPSVVLAHHRSSAPTNPLQRHTSPRGPGVTATHVVWTHKIALQQTFPSFFLCSSSVVLCMPTLLKQGKLLGIETHYWLKRTTGWIYFPGIWLDHAGPPSLWCGVRPHPHPMCIHLILVYPWALVWLLFYCPLNSTTFSHQC